MFYRKIDNLYYPYETTSKIRVRYFSYPHYWKYRWRHFFVFRLVFFFETLISMYNKKKITRWFEHMKFIFSRKKDFTSERSERVKYFFHSKTNFICSRHRVISSNYHPYICQTTVQVQQDLTFLKTRVLKNNWWKILFWAGIVKEKQTILEVGWCQGISRISMMVYSVESALTVWPNGRVQDNI